MLGGISIWQLLIVLVIVVLLFGTKKLKNIGGDMGEAIKGFKKGIKDDEEKESISEDKTETTTESTTEKVETKDSEKS